MMSRKLLRMEILASLYGLYLLMPYGCLILKKGAEEEEKKTENVIIRDLHYANQTQVMINFC